MPVPFILGGIAAAVGAFGAKKAYDGYKAKSEAEDLNNEAESIYDHAKNELETSRNQAQSYLEKLGEAKIHLHKNSLKDFIEIFSKIKNVEIDDFAEDEFQFNIKEFIKTLDSNCIEFSKLVGGGIASLGAGALAGIGAYSSVGFLATASTGTAIASLSGAAATNATLAWLGGGSIAAGGFGMSVGIAILGGIVAAPVLAVGGFLYSKTGEEALYNAESNLMKARALAKEFETAQIITDAIAKIVAQSLNVIEKIDSLLCKELQTLKLIVIKENDYAKYSQGEKEYLRFIVNLVKTLTGICRVNVLTDDGIVNEEFKKAIEFAQNQTNKIINYEDANEENQEPHSNQEKNPWLEYSFINNKNGEQ
ncbi:hypothetical protein [Campylobacter sp. 2457A]|uniref:hypothetical protein n=1 Tax=Campylobacter sp. 2457A TaxID=2735784 RepID=UPI00301E0A89|nr:hypothetical protein [Campylobacter sp. 2457A]